MFNIGDKVRVTAIDSDSSKELDGQVCTIETVCSDHCFLVEEPSIKSPWSNKVVKRGVWKYEIKPLNYVEPKKGTFTEELTKIKERIKL